MKLLVLIIFLTTFVGQCHNKLELKEKEIKSINIHISDCNIMYFESLSIEDIKSSERIYYLEIKNHNSISEFFNSIQNLTIIKEENLNPIIVLDVIYDNKSMKEIIIDSRGIIKIDNLILLDLNFKLTEWIKKCLPLEEKDIINKNCMQKHK